MLLGTLGVARVMQAPAQAIERFGLLPRISDPMGDVQRLAAVESGGQLPSQGVKACLGSATTCGGKVGIFVLKPFARQDRRRSGRLGRSAAVQGVCTRILGKAPRDSQAAADLAAMNLRGEYAAKLG